MYPVLFGRVSSLLVLWSTAIVLGSVLTVAAWRRDTGSGAKAAIGVAAVAALFLLGTKALFVIENPRSALDGGWWQFLVHGFRFPGGVLLTMVGAPLVLRGVGLPIMRFIDTTIAPAGLCIAVARIGCLLNGCCFGAPADIWWGLSYPARSRAFRAQVATGLIPTTAAESLPTHPLPVYFALAGIGVFLVATWMEPRRSYPGQLTVLFLLVWGFSTALIEQFRGALMDETPPVGWAVGLAVGIAAAGALLVMGRVHGSAAGEPREQEP